MCESVCVCVREREREKEREKERERKKEREINKERDRERSVIALVVTELLFHFPRVKTVSWLMVSGRQGCSKV